MTLEEHGCYYYHPYLSCATETFRLTISPSSLYWKLSPTLSRSQSSRRGYIAGTPHWTKSWIPLLTTKIQAPKTGKNGVIVNWSLLHSQFTDLGGHFLGIFLCLMITHFLGRVEWTCHADGRFLLWPQNAWKWPCLISISGKITSPYTSWHDLRDWVKHVWARGTGPCNSLWPVIQTARDPGRCNVSNDFMALTPAKFPISLNRCYTHDI